MPAGRKYDAGSLFMLDVRDVWIAGFEATSGFGTCNFWHNIEPSTINSLWGLDRGSGLKRRKRVSIKLAMLLCSRCNSSLMVQSAEDGINQKPKPVCDGEVYLHQNSYELLTRVDSERE